MHFADPDADGFSLVLLMMGKLDDIVLHFRLVAFLDAGRLSTVGVGRVVFRP